MFCVLEANEECKSCGAPIRWVKTIHGNWMPLDVESTADGNIAIMEDGSIQVVGVVPHGKTAKLPRYKSHFATCPFAAEHRRNRG